MDSIETQMEEHQITSCFPNDNNKRIDYVIAYKYMKKDLELRSHDFEKKNTAREKFRTTLVKESILIHEIKFKKGDHVQFFLLLNCPNDRLLDEAEKLKFEMRLKNDCFKFNDTYTDEIKWISKLKKCLIRRPPVKQDDSENIVSIPYDKSIKFLFEKCDKRTLNGSGPFSTNVRSLLLDNILNNLNYEDDPTHQEIKGLAHMLDEKNYDDAFVLHDSTSFHLHLLQMVEFSRKEKITKRNNTNSDDHSSSSDEEFKMNTKQVKHDGDARKVLHNSWAKITNFYRTQPLWLIREYFGETVAFYFAWVGMFIWCLFFPTMIGVVFFIVGIIISARKTSFIIDSNSTTGGIKDAAIYGNYYLNLFADSFDNDLTPYFALIISIWGAIYSELWKRENVHLAYEWNVLKYEKNQQDLPEFVRKTQIKEEYIKNKSNFVKFLYRRDRVFKLLVSYSVLVFMAMIVCIDIALVVLLRIYIKKKVFYDQSTLQVIVGDIGSTIINTIFIMILNFLYKFIAIKFTKWENYRTQTQYDDALILKLFIFEFVNSYGSLFYLAFFRKIDYQNGLFNLGPDFQDKCDNDNCMALLSIQLLVVFLIKPLPSVITNIIWPLINIIIKKINAKTKPNSKANSDTKTKKSNKEIVKKLNEKKVSTHIALEKNKADCETTIREEYTQKVILYGYLMLFASSFSLGPLILLIINVIDLRVDALRLLWLFRRPVGYRAEDIGAWFPIIRFLNIVGIISNAFLIAFTSNWSKSFLLDKLENRLIFVVAFEHVVFVIWFAIIYILPDVPRKTANKIKKKDKLLKDVIRNAKNLKSDLKEITNNVINTVENEAKSLIKTDKNKSKKHSYSDLSILIKNNDEQNFVQLSDHDETKKKYKKKKSEKHLRISSKILPIQDEYKC